MVIANDVSDKRIGFNSDHNAVTVLCKNPNTTTVSSTVLALKTKHQLAEQLIQMIAQASQNEPLNTTSL